MKSLHLVAIFLGLVVISTGCGPTRQLTPQLRPLAKTAKASRAATNLIVEGTPYLSNCKTGTDEYAGIKFPGTRLSYAEKELKFNKKQLFFTTADDCNNGLIAGVVVQETGTLVKTRNKSTVTAKTMSTATSEDFNFEQTTITISNALVVAAFNSKQICGISDWEVNIEKDVSVRNGETPCLGKASPRTEKKIVLMENGQLFLGETTDGTAPTEADKNTVFVKQ